MQIILFVSKKSDSTLSYKHISHLIQTLHVKLLWFRSVSHSLLEFYTLHRAFEQRSVRFASLNETFDTSSPAGRAMLKLVLVFAELEREQTAERTRVAIRARAARGLWNGGRPPLGYTLEAGGRLRPHPEEAALVQTMFRQYIELRSSVKLAARLSADGYRQKARGALAAQPAFTVNAVQYILQSRVYLGEIHHLGDRFDGQHPPLITLEEFTRVQEILSANAKNRRGPPLRTQYDYLLTGLLRCACGHALTTSAGNGKGGRYHYYRCVAIQKRVGHPCPVRQIRADAADTAVMGAVRRAARDPALLAEAVEEANRLVAAQVGPLHARVEALRREVAAADRTAEETLSRILAAGVGANATARRLLQGCEERQEQLRAALAAAEGELAAREVERLDLEVMVGAIRSFDDAFERLTVAERREVLHLMIRQIVVYPDRLQVELYEGESAVCFLQAIQRRAGAPGVPAQPCAVPAPVPAPVPDPVPARVQSQRTPGVDQGFVTDKVEYPRRDLNA